MSADYGSATINAAVTTGPPGGPAVQPPIAWDRLTGANTELWNDHIGSRMDDAATAAQQNPLIPGGNYIAAQNTPARNNLGAEMRWATCVAGCADNATGTLTAGVFVVGAGTAVARAPIPANGFGWVQV